MVAFPAAVLPLMGNARVLPAIKRVSVTTVVISQLFLAMFIAITVLIQLRLYCVIVYMISTS